jgi:hypothetical protein
MPFGSQQKTPWSVAVCDYSAVGMHDSPSAGGKSRNDVGVALMPPPNRKDSRRDCAGPGGMNSSKIVEQMIEIEGMAVNEEEVFQADCR